MGQVQFQFDHEGDDFHFLETPAHPEIARLAAYWQSKRGGRTMPERSDIVPGEIVSLLPHTVIYDVLEGGKDFRVRVFGTGLVELVGEERTGKRVSEFGENCNPPTNAGAVRRRWMDSMTAAYAAKAPVFVAGSMSSSRRSYINWHGVSCPLGNANGEPAQIIGLMIAG